MDKKLIIFDFDGTLVDTVKDVALCFNQALIDCGFPEQPLDFIYQSVGGNIEVIVAKLLPANSRDDETINRVRDCYRKLYFASDKPSTKPYDGIEKMLDSLKEQGFLLAVNSNKGHDLLEDMVNKTFGKGYFDSVLGYCDAYAPKPSAEGVEKICNECGMSMEHTFYVGDGLSDVKTAANASIPCYFVTWGQGTISQWDDDYSAIIVDTVTDWQDKLLNLCE